jgi:hypothetical protein
MIITGPDSWLGRCEGSTPSTHRSKQARAKCPGLFACMRLGAGLLLDYNLAVREHNYECAIGPDLEPHGYRLAVYICPGWARS